MANEALTDAILARLDRLLEVQAAAARMTAAAQQRQAKLDADAATRPNVIMGTDIRRARGEIVTIKRPKLDDRGEVVRGHVKGDRVQSQLDRLLRRHEIEARQYAAGNQLALDVEKSEAPIKSQLNLEVGGGGDIEPAFWACGNHWRIREALVVIGPASGVVLWVAVAGRPASEWAERRGFRKTTGIDILRMGLTALADHYRLDSRVQSGV